MWVSQGRSASRGLVVYSPSQKHYAQLVATKDDVPRIEVLPDAGRELAMK
jgi:hypothetical protein